jgi:hypothetical protein
MNTLQESRKTFLTYFRLVRRSLFESGNLRLKDRGGDKADGKLGLASQAGREKRFPVLTPFQGKLMLEITLGAIG